MQDSPACKGEEQGVHVTIAPGGVGMCAVRRALGTYNFKFGLADPMTPPYKPAVCTQDYRHSMLLRLWKVTTHASWRQRSNKHVVLSVQLVSLTIHEVDY